MKGPLIGGLVVPVTIPKLFCGPVSPYWHFVIHVCAIGQLKAKTVPIAADSSGETFITNFQGMYGSFYFWGRIFQYVFILQV